MANIHSNGIVIAHSIIHIQQFHFETKPEIHLVNGSTYKRFVKL